MGWTCFQKKQENWDWQGKYKRWNDERERGRDAMAEKVDSTGSSINSQTKGLGQWEMGRRQINGWTERDTVCWGRARREKIWCRHSNGLSPAPPEAHSALSCRNTFLIKAYKSCFVRTSPHPIDFKMVNQASSPFDAHESMCSGVHKNCSAAAGWVISQSHLIPGRSGRLGV